MRDVWSPPGGATVGMILAVLSQFAQPIAAAPHRSWHRMVEVRAVPAQMWAGVRPVPEQMREGVSPVTALIGAG